MRRPTKAQTKILARMADGGVITPDRSLPVRIVLKQGNDVLRLIPKPTLRSLKAGGWVSEDHGALCWRITDAGRREVAITNGAFRVDYPCGECGNLKSIQVKTYREIQRGQSGINCYDCWSKAMLKTAVRRSPGAGRDGSV